MDRFWSKVDKTENCWNWTAGTYEKGYGLYSIKNRNYRAHRVSYEMHKGPIPEGMLVLHQCDNPRCVRPDHLFLGTNADNMADKIAKGREAHVGAPGSANGLAKLTEDQVIAIRQEAGTHQQVADKYGVSRRAIMEIRSRRRWKHI
jgi:hypothetical protein